MVRNALTLIELIVVLTILAALSGIMLPLFAGTIQNANAVATDRTLTVIRTALTDYWRDTKWIPLDGILTVADESNRLHIDWLYNNPISGDNVPNFDPNTALGWNGPYLSGSTGTPHSPGYPTLIDAWNQVIVIQDVNPALSLRDVRIVSGGPNKVIDIPAATATSALTATDIGDDQYVALTLQ